ncbi:MAG: stage III sporulation AC/AD family protein [Clostridia bacterium]|nr:stage III sporulation AC/AD family protein [Clostridia bacterium]
MSILQLSGCAILSVFLIFLLRQLRTELALPARLAAVLLLCGAALALYLPVVERMRALFSLADGSDLATPVLRATGIALIAELTASFCRDLGEGSVADGVLLFGKLEILVLCLPLIDAVLEIAKELLKF